MGCNEGQRFHLSACTETHLSGDSEASDCLRRDLAPCVCLALKDFKAWRKGEQCQAIHVFIQENASRLILQGIVCDSFSLLCRANEECCRDYSIIVVQLLITP